MVEQDGVLLEFGSIRVDPRRRIVVRAGENVPLPPRAFDLLLLLVQRRGELVPKEELLTRIWPDIHVEESSLPVMISLIRRAIGDDGRRQQDIQTVSKYGYRFIGEVKETRLAVEHLAPVPAAPPINNPTVFSAEAARPADAVARAAMWRHPRLSIVAACMITVFAVLFLSRQFGTDSRNTLASEKVSGETSAGTQISPGAAAKMWYEKGRYAWNLQTKAGILQSIEYYQKAIMGDAGYAPAWAGLAVSYVVLPSYSHPSDDEVLGRARADALKAINLNNNLADAHIALGMVYMIDDWDFVRSERELRRAVEFDPSSSFAQGELALCLVAVGRTDEAVAHAREAKALDPLSSRAATDLGIVLYYGHRFTEAKTEFEEILKLNPYSYRTHVNLGKTYLSLEKFEDARREFEEASSLSNHDPLSEGLTAKAKAQAGDIEGARSILAALEQRARTTYVAPISFAFAAVGLGRLDDTLVYLKRARRDRAIAAVYMKVDPNWEPLHGNAEFGKLIQGIALAQPSNSSFISDTSPAVPENSWPIRGSDEEPEKTK